MDLGDYLVQQEKLKNRNYTLPSIMGSAVVLGEMASVWSFQWFHIAMLGGFLAVIILSYFGAFGVKRCN